MAPQQALAQSVNATAPVTGPGTGPAMPTAHRGEDDDYGSHQAPLSYSARREIIQSLTLPPIANTAVPPSPPGSPEPSTSAKIRHFLGLKSRGFHFNEKLASSSALQNPSLLQNLMEFAGIDTEIGQHRSSLPDGLAPIPEAGFPKEAYVEELNKSQQKIAKRKEMGKRDKVDFVASESK